MAQKKRGQTPFSYDRETQLARLRAGGVWDAVIIGGGATGLGIAVDAAQRGLRVALLEARDFGAGTSSRSTKLVHGGVRYLAQGNIKLVHEALAERALILRNAPHIAHRLEFVVPCYNEVDRLLLRVGLGMYDLLAGARSIGPTRWLSREETLARLPGIKPAGLRGGVSYWDGQFDDARMCRALAHTAASLGAVPVTGLRCEELLLAAGTISGVVAHDVASGQRLQLTTACVFNATGVWADAVRQLADPAVAPVIRVSQGSHVVVDRRFMPADAALMVPKTPDGRVLFAIPWQGELLIGTTDVPREDMPEDPQPSAAEIDFILQTAAGYLQQPITRADVRRSFAGLRPLYSPQRLADSASISREHAVLREAGGLFTIVGGKWTTYRKMAVDALAAAARAGLVPDGESQTATLQLLDG
jgi:glycerol-3-phosphate dehydrogenase